MKITKHIHLIRFLSAFVLVALIASQVVPSVMTSSEHEMIELIDFDENEEKDNEENELKEHTAFAVFYRYIPSVKKLRSTSASGIPTPPYLETQSPPPDFI